jgi:hypothetical protein
VIFAIRKINITNKSDCKNHSIFYMLYIHFMNILLINIVFNSLPWQIPLKLKRCGDREKQIYVIGKKIHCQLGFRVTKTVATEWVVWIRCVETIHLICLFALCGDNNVEGRTIRYCNVTAWGDES